MRILLIDDSKSVRRQLTRLFEATQEAKGVEVQTAPDGFEALSQVVAWRPDVVVLDISMPRLDGYQTCALIKSNPDFRHIKVVMLSSNDGLFDRARAKLAGCDAHLSKPIVEAELLELVLPQANSVSRELEV